MAGSNRDVICDVLMAEAFSDKNVVVLCSDSRGSASMTRFTKAFPDQFVEVGIAEQDLVGIAAGLAAAGKKSYAFSPASFLATRAYEQAKVDAAYSETDVKLVGISGGVSYGALGMTHHSCQDIAAMSALTGMRVYLPSDAAMTRKLMKDLYEDAMPAYIRVTRGASKPIYQDDELDGLAKDKAKVIRQGRDIMITACGEMVAEAVEAASILADKGIDAGVIDMYCLKPFDADTLIGCAAGTRLVAAVEEHGPYGGLGALCAQALCERHPMPLVHICLPDEHMISGTPAEMFHYYGLDAEGIAARLEKEFAGRFA